MKLPWSKPRQFFSEAEQQQLVTAIQNAEKRTSGEIRLFIESKCKYIDALDRAKEIFGNLKMHETAQRNGTLIYLAMDDHQVAIFGDEGIHQKVGTKYWTEELEKIISIFKTYKLVDGICTAIADLGEVLHTYFPFNEDTDKNELPDEIVFGA